MVCEGEFALSPVVSVFFSVHYPQLASSNFLTHCGPVTQICAFTLQLCKTDDANLRF